METYDQKRRRIYGKLFLPEYLKVFDKILNIKINTEHLLSIVETDHVIAKGRGNLYFEETILFADKKKLQTILKDTLLGVNEPGYIFYRTFKRIRRSFD